MHHPFIGAFTRSRHHLTDILGIVVTLGTTLLSSACVSIQADIPELQVTRSGLTFDGAPDVPLMPETSVTKTFDVQGPLLDVPENVKPDLYATSATITLRDGAPDLSFLRQLIVTVESTDAPGTSRRLLSYERAEGASVGQSLEIPVEDSSSALSELTAASTSYSLTASGVLPKQSWTVDVSVTYRGQLSIQP